MLIDEVGRAAEVPTGQSQQPNPSGIPAGTAGPVAEHFTPVADQEFHTLVAPWSRLASRMKVPRRRFDENATDDSKGVPTIPQATVLILLEALRAAAETPSRVYSLGCRLGWRTLLRFSPDASATASGSKRNGRMTSSDHDHPRVQHS